MGCKGALQPLPQALSECVGSFSGGSDSLHFPSPNLFLLHVSFRKLALPALSGQASVCRAASHSV